MRRKYSGHPSMAWGIIGHDWAVTLLRRSLVADRVTHAYLFSGPPQVGKTSLALALAQALNCAQPDPPCGQCDSCRKIARRVHPDLHMIEGEGAGGTIRIEQIRSLRREAVLAPYEGRYRVAILRRMESASTEAANSLLKLLEEPPSHMVLAVTATAAEALPATIASRCQRLDLRPVVPQVLETALRERGFPPPKAKLLASLSGGRVGWAIWAGEDETVLRQRGRELDRLVELLAADRLERLDFAAKANRDAGLARRRIELWTSWWRDLLLLSNQVEDGVINTDRLDELCLLAEQATPAEVLAGMNRLRATAVQLEANVNTRLAVEGLLLGLPCWSWLPQGRAHHDHKGAPTP